MCAYGDTGLQEIVQQPGGARSKFQGRAVGAERGTDRPNAGYGFHLDEHRHATLIVGGELHAASGTYLARSGAS